jgi:hypothetical protein
MPFRYHIDPSSQIGVIRLYDVVIGADLYDAVETFFGDDAWQPGFRLIWDARAVSRLVLAPEDADAFSSAIGARADRIGGARTAVVTEGFETYMSGLLLAIRSRKISKREIEMFPTIETALNWLGFEHAPAALLSD